MIRTDDVRVRIERTVPDLAGRVRNAGEFSQLVESSAYPAEAQSAFVLPGPLRGGPSQVMSGAFVQALSETIIVVLLARVPNDPTGAKGMDTITPLIRDVITALCGFQPSGAPGCFELSAGELVGAAQGRIIYHLEFALNDQVRIFA